MKTEDIERLKEICEKEGFEVGEIFITNKERIVLVKKIEAPSVKYIGWEHGYFECNYEIKFKVRDGLSMNDDIGNYLAKCLQEYLSK